MSRQVQTASDDDETAQPLLSVDGQSNSRRSQQESAAPPVLFLLLPYIPLGLAIFIAGTRYFDFRNHGFDVLAGAAIGIATAWFGFRWYHPPVSGCLWSRLGSAK